MRFCIHRYRQMAQPSGISILVWLGALALSFLGIWGFLTLISWQKMDWAKGMAVIKRIEALAPREVSWLGSEYVYSGL